MKQSNTVRLRCRRGGKANCHRLQLHLRPGKQFGSRSGWSFLAIIILIGKSQRPKLLKSISQPEPFWEIRVKDLSSDPGLIGLCIGYEQKKWRAEQFAKHVMEWLPEFALTQSELDGMNSGNMIKLAREAAKKVYTSAKFEKRGEFGELFLHVAVRQVFNSIPAISKIYYKSATNETVKGFDVVHVVGPPEKMELWVGEVKFYEEINRAIADVVKELQEHTQSDYLRSEFLVITGKIDPSSVHAAPLRKLLSPNTSLDEVFKRACIPVLLTYDSSCLASFEECSAAYVAAFEAEIRKNYHAFALKARAAVPAPVAIRLFLLPLNTKKALIAALDKHLKTWQAV